MKLPHLALGLSLIVFTGDLLGQTNQTRLFLPFLDKESQSNVVVSVYGEGQPCSMEYTNVLSNTNLFTSEEQVLIKEVFVKYQSVTTNLGPAGTVLAGLYKTNLPVKERSRTIEIQQWVSRFQYTNYEACETISFDAHGAGLTAEFRTSSNDGYNAALGNVSGGTLLIFKKVKRNLLNGVCAAFDDRRDQGIAWNYGRADFSNAHLEQYMQYTNGLIVGKYLIWDTENGKIVVLADFKEPYAFDRHRVQIMPR